MLSLPAGTRIYLAVEAVDMRKQFDGLWAVAREKLREDPRAGAFFVFTNKRRNRVKILYFDGTGPWVFAKRLDGARERVDGVSPEPARGEEHGCPSGSATSKRAASVGPSAATAAVCP